MILLTFHKAQNRNWEQQLILKNICLQTNHKVLTIILCVIHVCGVYSSPAKGLPVVMSYNF